MTDADDFSRAPWLYPGTPVDRGDPFDAEALDRARSGGLVLVVAVGSNASRAVLQRKFTAFGVGAPVAFLRARVTGLRAGHSAHVSKPGYIPAAPVVDPEVTSDLVASLFDANGLAAIDATEPNYVRQELSADRFPIELELADGESAGPAAFSVYESRHGILRPPSEPSLELQPQEQLFARLAAECADFARLVSGDARDVMRAFAASSQLRTAGRRALRAAGWVQHAGFAEE